MIFIYLKAIKTIQLFNFDPIKLKGHNHFIWDIFKLEILGTGNYFRVRFIKNKKAPFFRDLFFTYY